MNLLLHRGADRVTLTLAEGTQVAGGSESDDHRIPELPPHFLRLHREGDRLMVEAARVFSIDGVLVPPRVPRLLLVGERLELPGGVAMTLEPEPEGAEGPVGTVAVLRQFLTDPEHGAAGSAPQLICLTGLDVGRRFPVCDGTSAIGRGEDVAIRVRDRAVSRRHARILKLAGGHFLEDAGSPNGVFLNGVRLVQRAELRHGDILELGQSLLRFEVPQERAAGSAQPGPLPAPEPLSASEPALPPSVPFGGSAPAGLGWKEWAMIVGGAALALAGVVVTWTIAR